MLKNRPFPSEKTDEHKENSRAGADFYVEFSYIDN